MPTSLPLTFSAAVIEPAKSSSVPGPIWVVMVWAAVMLLVGFSAVGADAAAFDPFQLLAHF